MGQEFKYDAFLSHSAKDKAVVRGVIFPAGPRSLAALKAVASLPARPSTRFDIPIWNLKRRDS